MVVLSMMVSLVYNMVDTYFIALTGKQELVAGVSLAAPIFTLMIAFGDIFGLGGSSLISRLFGEKREEEAKRASIIRGSQSEQLLLYWGLCRAIFCGYSADGRSCHAGDGRFDSWFHRQYYSGSGLYLWTGTGSCGSGDGDRYRKCDRRCILYLCDE